MAKLIFIGIGVLALVALLFTVFQYFVVSFLSRREEDGEE
jgi:hypothetical protein